MRFLIAALLTLSFVTTPVFVHAYYDTSDAYRVMSVEERIAYLLGMVAQLQMIMVALEAEDGRFSSGGDVSVSTLSARGVESEEAELRGEIDLRGEDEARVWFEYGEDDDDLDEQTSRRRITDSRGDERTFGTIIGDLEEDERYYYRAVAEDESGDLDYGIIRSFETDEDRNGSGNVSRGDYFMSLSDENLEEGDLITIDWEVPNDVVGNKNWIGLYRTGDSNRQFVEWKYLEDEDEGEIDFIIDDSGEYEFRLFLNNSYNVELTSEEVNVD